MDSTRLGRAGWVALLGIPLTALTIAVNVWSKSSDVLSAVLLQTVVAILILTMGLFLIRTWKGMLNGIFDFHQTDAPLNASITLVYVSTAGRVISAILSTSALGPIFDIALTVTAFVGSAIAIWFAVRLLRLDDNLCGYRKAYCFLSITNNVCGLTIFLIPIAILVYIVEAVVEAMLFFSMAERVRQVACDE